MPRILAVAPFAFTVAALAFACGDSESTSAPSTLPEAGSPDRNAPASDSGNPTQPDAQTNDAADSAVSTCPIANDATVAAQIKVSVDDQFKLYVNGTLMREFTGTWNNVQTIDVTLNRNPTKKNVIAVEAINTAKISGLDRMLVAELTYTIDTTVHTIITDATWTSGTTLTTGWEALDFAETGWAAATVEGVNGDSPYSTILGSSVAKYLWSYDSAQVDVGTKPDMETVYFRKTFYIGQAGAPQATPGTCN